MVIVISVKKKKATTLVAQASVCHSWRKILESITYTRSWATKMLSRATLGTKWIPILTTISHVSQILSTTIWIVSRKVLNVIPKKEQRRGCFNEQTNQKASARFLKFQRYCMRLDFYVHRPQANHILPAIGESEIFGIRRHIDSSPWKFYKETILFVIPHQNLQRPANH